LGGEKGIITAVTKRASKRTVSLEQYKPGAGEGAQTRFLVWIVPNGSATQEEKEKKEE